MSNEIANRNAGTANVKSLLSNISYKKRFEEILGKKSVGFMSSLINISNTNALKDADPKSIISSAVMAATLDLPIDPNLGHAWIVPFKDHGVKKAQFQMAAKGFIQLAQRSGQYKKINKGRVYQNQFKSWNPFTESLEADFSVKGEGDVVGYFGYFELLNGFVKTVFWYKEDITKHAKKYSKSFNNGPWQSEFDKMAEKTVVKSMLKEYGPLSIEMQKAIMADQAVINNNVADGEEVTSENVEYVDKQDIQETEYTEVKQQTKVDDILNGNQVEEDEFKDTPFAEESEDDK